MFALRTSIGFRSALQAADARLSVDPTDGTAAGVRALVYGNAVDYLAMEPAEAREAKYLALALAIELAPNSPWTRAAYGLIHLTDDPLAAERELTTCIDEHPAFIECYNLYGDHLRKTERQEQAGDIYMRAMHQWAGDGELIVSYALLLQETGGVPQALTLLDRLTQTQPNFARGHWHRAVMLYETEGDRALALHEAKRALALDPLIWNGAQFLEMLDRVPAA
jgi:tetratricopeptide (TPR) repeat protein